MKMMFEGFCFCFFAAADDDDGNNSNNVANYDQNCHKSHPRKTSVGLSAQVCQILKTMLIALSLSLSNKPPEHQLSPYISG